MPSLNLDLNYFDHSKTMRLVAILGRGADVLPIRLWAYAGRLYPETGQLPMLANEIEQRCGWWGKKGEMISAMIETGFVKRDGDIFTIHDWLDHSGHLATFKKRAVKAARKRWGVNRKRSNASSNAKSEPKQCSSSAVQCSAVTSNAVTPSSAAPKLADSEPPYKRPDPKAEPLRTLVFAYKVKKGFPPDDRTWDRQEWPRASKSGRLILEAFDGNLRAAVGCLESLGDYFDKKGLGWTLETIEKHCLEWKLKNGGYSDGATGGERVFSDFLGTKGASQGPPNRGLTSAGEILAGSGVLPDFQHTAGSAERVPRGGNGGAAPSMGEDQLADESDGRDPA